MFPVYSLLHSKLYIKLFYKYPYSPHNNINYTIKRLPKKLTFMVVTDVISPLAFGRLSMLES